MGVATIALLGPLAVNGDAAALSPRDRVVLSALALRSPEVSSVERLADALWGSKPPPSWPKVVPGCIHRLRRALGAVAIETTPYGYRLVVDDDEIDARRFEHLLQRGRELLVLGEADRAAYTLGEAVGLWRGGAYLDLDGWEPGRMEAARLAELRLEAQETRIDAALQAGRHADMLAPAQSAVAQAPLRERRWGLLALAQYRCGRQGEALQTLRRARRMLIDELGLDPGPDLIALETAILRQDPSLVLADPATDSGECPYLGLVGYDVDDAETFFGREWEVADCVNRLTTTGFLAVAGPSGSGKSSLVRAGVGAALARAGGRPVVMTPGPHPMSAIADLDTVGVALIVDQFEEVFTNCADPEERQRFCAEVVGRAQWCRVIIAVRGDHLGDLAVYPELARLVERGLYLLGPMDEDGLRVAITGPADRAGLLLEPGLVDLLVREVEGEPGALPLLSHALRQTWERRSDRTLTVAGYQETGGIRGGVARTAENLYESLSPEERTLLRRLLLRLISTTDDGDPIRTRVSPSVLLTDPDRARMIDRLAAARLVTTDHDTVQVAHECLGRAWPRLSTWLDDDVEGLRIQRHLSASADAWDGLGRPPSELYRGMRLTQAVRWRDDAEPSLTRIETDFLSAGEAALDAEERAVREQARQRVRVRRRNRLLVAGVAGIVIVALLAGLIALRQQRQREAADLAAEITEATRVDDAARSAGQVDQALLLAVEANHLHDSADTRSELAALLAGHQDLIRSLIARDVVRTLAVSPDGRTLLVGEGDTGTSVYRTDTLQRTAGSEDNGWTIRFRPDGQQVVFAGRGSGGLGEAFDTLSLAVADPGLAGLQHMPAGDIATPWLWAWDAAYSGDGRRVAATVLGLDGGGHLLETRIMVWDSARPTAEPMEFGGDHLALAVALSPDGGRVYALTDQPAVDVFDTVTGTQVGTLGLPQNVLPQESTQGDLTGVGQDLSDTLELSPDGRTLAIGEQNDVVLLDAATLAERARLRGHHDRVQALQFSADGRMLASGGVDQAVELWDVLSGGEIARLTGPGGAVLALAFAPDGGTLYSGGADHRVLVWDLAGPRRFISRVVAGSVFGPNAGLAVPSPDGRSVIFAGTTASSGPVQFLDVASGRLDPASPDPTGGRLAVWLPPEDAAVITVVDERDLRRWDRGSGRAVAQRPVATAEISALAAAPDGDLVVGERSGVVQRVDPHTLKTAGQPVSLGHPVTALAVLPGHHAVALLDDMTYVVVDLDADTVIRTGDLSVQGLAAAVSGDGARLAVGGRNGEVGLLDLTDGEWIAPPHAGHDQYVLSAAFSADGGTLVTSSLDGSVRLWDGRTGEPIAQAHVGRTAAWAVLPADQQAALIAERSGSVYRLETDFSSWISYACTVVGRSLTSDEWQAVFGDRPYHRTCPTG